MARPIMHRLVRVLLASSTLLLLPAPRALAQEPSPVALRLSFQTPWNSPDQTQLDLRFTAQNTGSTPIEDLSIGLALYGRVITRTQYEQSLVTDPSPAIIIDAETLPREGQIAAGETRAFEVVLDLTFPGIDPSQSGIYPLKLDLRSHGVPVVALRSPVIFLVRQPEVPIRLAWTFVLSEPIAFGPDGVFTSTVLESSLEPGGRLAGQLRALSLLIEDPSDVPVDVVVSPVLLTQLGRMRAGYTVLENGRSRTVEQGKAGSALAADALAQLARIAAAPGVELSAMPFSGPQLPSLVAGGLSRDLNVQLDRGTQVAASFLKVNPSPAILRPPRSAIDDATLSDLTARGVSVLMLDAGSVATTPDPLGFALPPAATVGSPARPAVAIVPDQSVAALIAQPFVFDDPVRGAQAALGELAIIWQERPSDVRGMAVTLSEALRLPGGFYAAFARDVASAPWLRPTRATELAADFPPPGLPSPLAAPSVSRFSDTYVDELKQARRRIDIYRSMVVDQSTDPDRLDTYLLLAESSDFLISPTAGLAFIRAVRDQLSAVFGAVRPDTGQVVTLTARSGSRIPVHVTNEGDRALRVKVQLVSQHLLSSPSDTVVLEPSATRTLFFDVDLKTNGRFPVQVQVESPSGRVIGESTLIVRSTRYNRIALVITIGAALVLLLAWARRFLPRRTS